MSAQAPAVPLAENVDPKASRYDRDFANHVVRDDFPTWLRQAARQTGTKPLKIVLDYVQCRGPGRLSLQDYFLYRLYDNSKFSPEEKRRFISDGLHWPVTHKCCDLSWQAMTEDKWMSYTLLTRFGLPVPTTLAVIDVSERDFADTLKLSTPAELKQFLASCSDFPLFCKANNGLGSFGAFIITGIDGNLVLRAQDEPVDIETLFRDIASDRTYLIQARLENHKVIRKMTEYLSTIRMVNFFEPNGVRTPFAALKLPAANNIADNFWRKGNFLADVDVETGVLRRIIRGKGVFTEELECHPDGGDRLVGLRLPFWNDVKKLNAKAAALFAPIRYGSLDIALTDSGPVVVEMNTGGSFELPQLASGKGLLTDENLEFFRRHKCPLRG